MSLVCLTVFKNLLDNLWSFILTVKDPLKLIRSDNVNKKFKN